jgi:cytochrome c biogenesis protein ResB
MLKRVVFAVRSFWVDPWPRLGSWRLSVVLMVAATLYYLFLAIWAGSTPAVTVQSIARLTPFWIVYLLLLVNTAVCLWRRLPALLREISSERMTGSRAADWRLDLRQELDRDLEWEEVRKMTRLLGYRQIEGVDGVLEGVRRRWTGFGTYLFHGAFFVVALGFGLTMVARQEATIWVSEGEFFEGLGEQFLSQSTPRLLASGLSPVTFEVRSIEPEFWRDQMLFTRLEAALEFADGSQGTTKINRPLWLGWKTFLRLSGFGYAPRYELADRQGFVLDSAFIKLNVFPPGQTDYFRLPSYPHRIYQSILPDAEWTDAGVVNASLNLENPAIDVEVTRGKLRLGRRIVRLGESYEIEGLLLTFPEIRYWGEFTIVSDPGAPVLFLGYLVGLVGLVFKLLGPRQELRWVARSSGEWVGVVEGWGGTQPDSRRLLRHLGH